MPLATVADVYVGDAERGEQLRDQRAEAERRAIARKIAQGSSFDVPEVVGFIANASVPPAKGDALREALRSKLKSRAYTRIEPLLASGSMGEALTKIRFHDFSLGTPVVTARADAPSRDRPMSD